VSFGAMSKPENERVQVVIPVYNSASSLAPLYSRLKAALDGQHFPWGVTFVDDYSRDGSWKEICALHERYDNICGIRLSKNGGQHGAIFTGLRAVDASFYVTMDDDLQHDPRDIIALLKPLAAGAHVAYGRFQHKKHPAWKRLGSLFNDWTAAFLINKPRGLYLSPFRVFSRSVRDAIIAYQGRAIYLDALILKATSAIIEVPVNHNERALGQSEYGFRKSLMLWLAMSLGFSLAPLRLASYLGLLISILGLSGTAYIIFESMTASTPPGWASLLAAISFLGGLQLLSLGLIGEYIGRLLVAVHNEPRHPIAEQTNGRG
jgi:glycosyltransferase involved in cell wall biosynthesis